MAASPTTAADGRAPGVVPPPPQADAAARAARLLMEYVAGGGYHNVTQYLQSLPPYIDDISRDLNANIYEQMSKDPVVASNFRAVKLAVLADPPTLRPAVDDSDDPLYDDAKREVAFCEWCFANLRTPVEDVADELLDGMAVGNRVAEQVYALVESGQWAGRLTLDRLKPKPRASTAFVVDAFSNVRGLLARLPGESWLATAGPLEADPKDVANFLPRNKFAVFSWQPKDGDPRGTSIYRPCYTPWWEKQQALGQWLKWLALCATPMLIATAGKDADDVTPTDPDGNPLPADPNMPGTVRALLNTLVKAQGGSALAVPFGTDVKWLTAQGAGTQFLSKIQQCDTAITRAITLQTLATTEGEHDARAAAQVHQDVMGLGVRKAKGVLGRVITWDVLYWLVAYNRGKAQADLLCPRCVFTPSEHHDRGAGLSAWASVGYQLAPSQMAAVDEEIGLPVRTEEEQAQAAQAAQQPPPGGPPGTPDAGAPGAGATAPDAPADAPFAAAHPDDGHWVTIEGTHVFIKGGRVAKGPPELVGRSPDSLPPRRRAEPHESAHAALAAGKPLSVAQVAAATGRTKDEAADGLMRLMKEGKVQDVVVRGRPAYRLTALPPGAPAHEHPAPAPAHAPEHPAPPPAPAARHESPPPPAPAAPAPEPPAARGAPLAGHALRGAIMDAVERHFGHEINVPIYKLRREVPAASRAEFDAALHHLRREGKLEFVTITDMRDLTPAQTAEGIPGVGETFAFVTLPTKEDFNF
jgi:hypothetical protein